MDNQTIIYFVIAFMTVIILYCNSVMFNHKYNIFIALYFCLLNYNKFIILLHILIYIFFINFSYMNLFLKPKYFLFILFIFYLAESHVKSVQIVINQCKTTRLYSRVFI